MFEDVDQIAGLTQTKQLAVGQALPKIVDSKKSAFAAHVVSLGPEKFGSFTPLFDRFTQMLSGTV